MTSVKELKTAPGELIDFETVYLEHKDLNPDFPELPPEVPERFRKMVDEFRAKFPVSKEIPEKTGRFERFDYTTDVYEDGKVYNKYAQVYLPWCYDPEDQERKYRVIYFQHGNTGEPEVFMADYIKILLDRLFLMPEIEPAIVVCTTYYFDLETDKDVRKSTGQVPAGDGNYPYAKPNFWKEITQSLMPKVELQYHTYLTEASDEALRKTREYRLFSGYSRGCVATWYMFHHALPYFGVFIPMSCMTTAGKDIKNRPTEEEVLAYLSAPVEKNPELPFFIYACNGGPDDVVAMTEQMKYITKAAWVSYGQDPKVNNMYYAVSDYFHGDFFAPQNYFNALPVLWPRA